MFVVFLFCIILNIAVESSDAWLVFPGKRAKPGSGPGALSLEVPSETAGYFGILPLGALRSLMHSLWLASSSAY